MILPKMAVSMSMSSSFSEIARSAAASLGYMYSSLKPEQLLTISLSLKGNDMFVSLPTGYGKSLCYAALPPSPTLRVGSIPSTYYT